MGLRLFSHVNAAEHQAAIYNLTTLCLNATHVDFMDVIIGDNLGLCTDAVEYFRAAV